MSRSRKQLEKSCRVLAPMLDQGLASEHGERVGFVLMVFDFGDKGNLAYISNSQREDVISTLKEITARLEAGLVTDPPGPKKEA